MVGGIGACIRWRYDMEMSSEGKNGSHSWREYCPCGKYGKKDTPILNCPSIMICLIHLLRLRLESLKSIHPIRIHLFHDPPPSSRYTAPPGSSKTHLP